MKKVVEKIKIKETKSKALCNLNVQLEEIDYQRFTDKCRELRLTKKAFINTAIHLLMDKIDECDCEIVY